MAETKVERPAPQRAPSTPIRRPVHRSWVCPRANLTRAGAQEQAMRSRAGARRAPPRSSTGLRQRAALRARPTMARARREAGQMPRPEDPTRAARRRALPTTEAVLRRERLGQRARPATRARAAAARLRAAAEEAARLQAAVEAALPRPVAEEVRLQVEQAVAEHRALPSRETALLPGGARPRSTSSCCLVNLQAARPTKARVGPSPTSVARPGWARRPAGPSSGWRPAAEAPGRPSKRPIPVAELRPAEPRSALQAAAGSAGSPCPYATVRRAGRRSCFSCPWSGCGGP
jgi:hypothetical protein